MPKLPELITIGELSSRSGVAPSALRYYEQLGLIASTRTNGNQRRYARATLRRVAVILAAHQLGVPLAQVRDAMTVLPADRTPNAADWAKLSRSWHGRLEARIEELERLRDRLTGCIGCGCLSLQRCKLLNADDVVARRGTGPRLLYPNSLGGADERHT